jgi:hypothetical protein
LPPPGKYSFDHETIFPWGQQTQFWWWLFVAVKINPPTENPDPDFSCAESDLKAIARGHQPKVFVDNSAESIENHRSCINTEKMSDWPSDGNVSCVS